MKCNQENLHKHNIDDLRQQGIYPVANLELFKTIENLDISDFCFEREAEIADKYITYLDKIYSMPKDIQKKYLDSIKIQEIMDTELYDLEDSYLYALYMAAQNESAMDYLLSERKSISSFINKEKIIKAHKKLLAETNSKRFAKKDYRTDNEAFVARKKNGEVLISYFSIDYRDIEKAIKHLICYYNGDAHNKLTLIKPIIIHGLVGAIQMFDDGNARLGKMLQNVKTFELTNKNLGISLESPALYNSRSYADYRSQYREKLGNIVIHEGNESWNSWINFNLNRIEDQLYYASSKLKEYQKAIGTQN